MSYKTDVDREYKIIENIFKNQFRTCKALLANTTVLIRHV